MKKRSSIIIFIVGILLFIMGISLLFLYNINPINMRFASGYTSAYYLSKDSPCTNYKYAVKGHSYDLNSCGYSSTDYITKKHIIVYDATNPKYSYLLSNYLIIFGMFALSIVIFLNRFIILLLKRFNLYSNDGSIMVLIIYLALLSIAIFMFKGNYILKHNRVTIRSYITDMIKTQCASNDAEVGNGVCTYAIVSYKLDDKKYERVIAGVKETAKIGDYVDLTVSKKNPYHAVLLHEQKFTIIYLASLIVIGIFFLVLFIYYKITGRALV